MAVYTLPCRPDLTHYSFVTNFGESSWGFEFRWNERAAAWFMDLRTAEDEPIVSSVRVTLDFPLAARVADSRKPPGTFIAFDTTGKGTEPGLGELGGRVQVLYFDEDEA